MAMQTKPAAPLKLPAPIARFFAHETADPHAVARCFSDGAVVRDEGHEHHGRAAISEWDADAVSKYEFSAEPLTAETVGVETTVTAHVTGSFPGSPVRLRFRFTVIGELISRLEIAP
jgi:hypothetical protein